MSSDIKNIKKHIADNIKDVFGSQELLIEEVSISTVIRNELFLANKEWIKGYKSFLKEPEDKGGFLKMISELKNLVSPKQISTPREQFLSFMKQYRKFLQHSLYIVDKEVDLDNLSKEDFIELLDFFPEVVICLTKEVVNKNGWQDIILEQLKKDFQKYSDAMYSDSYGKTIRVQRVTSIGTISLYSNATMNYFSVRNYLVLQNALLTNLDILSEDAQKNPFIYVNAFTRQEEISYLNKEYMIGLRKNINQKIFNILNMNNNSIFFGFIHFRLVKDNLPFMIEMYEGKECENLFQKLIVHINSSNENIQLDLSLIHEISQYMNIDSEDCKWERVSPYALENILFLLKNTIVNQGQNIKGTNLSLDFNEQSEIKNDISDKIDYSSKGSTLYSQILKLSLAEHNELDMMKKALDKKIIEFIIENFKYLSYEQKEKEYTWLLEKNTEKDRFEIILLSLARDNALNSGNVINFNKKEPNNEIEILVQIYLENIEKYQHRFNINYILWLNRYDPKIWELSSKISKNENIINVIPSIAMLNNSKKHVEENLNKLKRFLLTINTQEEQDKFFYLVEKVNKKLLGTNHIRSLLDGYKVLNVEMKETIDLITNHDMDGDLYREIVLDKELHSIIMKENDFETNAILNDSYLLKSKIPFKGIKTKLTTMEHENFIKYNVGSSSFKISHFLYAMSYEYIGDAAFAFEDSFSSFINQQRDKNSFENIASNEILFFLKDWIHRASREGYLINKLEEKEMEKQIIEMQENLVLEEEKAKEAPRARKKI